ncbi:MAG: ribose-phosphate diphosphokinase [Candidatus Nanoarchaeia archaeon]
MEEVVLIADSTGKGYGFAKGVYNYLKAKQDEKFSVKLTDIEKTTFKDGEYKIKICDNIRRRKCFLICDGNKPACQWFTDLIFTLEAMTFSSPEEINVVLPYMRFARQERKDESRVSVNAKAIAETISLYASRGMAVDLHAAQIQEYFKFPFDNLYSYPVLINYLKKYYKEMLENLVIVSPDLGGGKRAESLVKRLHDEGFDVGVAFSHKTRKKENEVEKSLVIGDVNNKNCLIVDDIIDTGNTLVKTAEALKEKGAKKVYAYGTHGLFTEGIGKFNVFDKVMISDTINKNGFENLEVVSLVNLFGEAIYRTVKGESLSSLFNRQGEEQDILKV